MRAVRVILLGLAGLLVAAILAAWLVPPRLDWTRYRARVAEVASRMLGQPVTIQGRIALTLLPVPGLTADRVTLADGALSVRALRLNAALWPLLAGVIEPRELVLQSPRLELPWPLPGARDLALPAAWPAGLAVRIDDGAATIGGFPAADVQASAAVGETGALSVVGRATIGGHGWTFQTRLTAAGRDGSSGLDLSLAGTGPLASTSAHFTGQMAGLTNLSGEAAISGDDLSALMPAPAASFRAAGRLTAADGLMAADDLAVELAGAPAWAAVALRLLPIQRLDLSLAIGRLDLQAWLLPLLHPPAADGPGLSVGLDLSAEAADLAGATLHRLRCAFDLSPQAAELREASAILPGEATLSVTGRITRGPAAAFTGEASVRTPDLPATAGWAAQAIGLDATIAGRLPRVASLAARVSATADAVTLQSVSGTADGAAIAGTLAIQGGPKPRLDLTARLARLDLDAWWPSGPPRWSALNGLAGATDIRLDLRAPAAVLHGRSIRDLVLRAEAGQGTLRLDQLSAASGTARMSASGTIDPAGALSAGRFELAAEQAAGLADLVPAGAPAGAPGWVAAMLQRAGAVHLAVTAQGPPAAISAHVELAAAGGQVRADPVIDLPARSMHGAVSLAHPSAAGLLALLGWLPDAPAWLGAGELRLRGEFALADQSLAAERLDLLAGGLQAAASLRAEWPNGVTRLSGRIAAASLSLLLPARGRLAALPYGLLLGWQAALDVAADRLLVGGWPVVADARARLGLADGVLDVGDFSAKLGGGTVTGAAAINAAATPPTVQAQARLEGAVLDGAQTGGAIDLLSGTASATVRVAAAGYSVPALRATEQGAATLDVAHGSLLGFDLARLREALLQAVATGTPEAELRADLGPALAGGRSAFDSLHAQATLSAGGLELRSADLSGADGQASATGVVASDGQGIDLLLALRPAIEAGPAIGLRLTGPLAAPTRTPDLSGVLRWLSHM